MPFQNSVRLLLLVFIYDTSHVRADYSYHCELELSNSGSGNSAVSTTNADVRYVCVSHFECEQCGYVRNVFLTKLSHIRLVNPLLNRFSGSIFSILAHQGDLLTNYALSARIERIEQL